MATPFHLQDEDHLVVQRASASTPDEERERRDGVTFVDIGSIQMNPATDYAEYQSTGKGLSSFARVTEDGRIIVSLDLKQKLPDLPKDYSKDVKEFSVDETGWRDVPKMSVVIMIVGSRGDVQPYVALGKLLLRDGHRVRIATHETFRSFVGDAGLEFFDIGGNPQDLMSYMVKNPGLMPGFTSLTNGDIGRKRKMLAEMIDGCWSACSCPCPKTGKTFAADAIISNPPAFAHIHCAEALGIPCLLSFTMPWSPTTAFPHPLVNVKSSNAENGLTNVLSYVLADLLTWQGIGDIINDFRAGTLGLPPLTLRSGPGLLDRVKVPWTYCMSPSLVGKPDDWKGHIDIAGFYFLDLATDYEPGEDLTKFLDAGPPPVYIGFGSIVIDDPKKMTETIFAALATSPPTRALVSAGWGGLGGMDIPENVFILGNVPHDWLFQKVSAVVHHGGAGTTAAGLQKGCPTVVVPFFGDQIFWGTMIHRAGAGPPPIPHKQLNAQNLRDAIQFALSPGAKRAAAKMAEGIKDENGLQRGLESFYRHLPLLNMRCDLDQSRLAVWWSTEYCVKLSAFAAQTLVDACELNLKSLDPHRSKEYETRKNVTDPVTGGGSAIFWTVTNYYAGIAQIFYSPVKGIIKTTTAIPKGVMDIVQSVHEGFYNVPKLYGSEVREHGKVTNFTSGIKEGSKGLFYGYYDGITGLIREPLKGAKEEGFIGAIKGSARSFVNVTMRPAAGVIGVVAHPIQGAWKGMQKTWAKNQEQSQRATRVSDGVEQVKNSTKVDRERIMARWAELKKTTKQRQKKYKEEAEKVMYEDEDEDRKQAASVASSSTELDRLGVHSSSSTDVSSAQESPASQTTVEGEDDVAFERDLEIAKQLSLAEQRGYERGLASQLG